MWARAVGPVGVTHSVYEAVLAVLFGVQNAVFDEDGNSSQDERHKEVHVDEVPGAVELPEDEGEGTRVYTTRP